MSDSGSSTSIEDVSAYLLNTRLFLDLLTPPACPTRSGPSSERLILAVPPRPQSSPDPGGLRIRDSGREQTARTRRPSGQCPGRPTSSGLGPRADSPNVAALGAVSLSAYFIGTRAPSRQPKHGDPRGSVPVGLHHRDSAYIIGTRPSGHFPSGLYFSPGSCSSPGSASGRAVWPHQELQPRAPSSWPITRGL